MLIFARALLDPTSPGAPALRTALSMRTPANNPGIEQALGWPVRRLSGRELLMHDGQTLGFSSILILEPAKGRAVVALANSAAEPGPEDLAFNIVGGQPVAPRRLRGRDHPRWRISVHAARRRARRAQAADTARSAPGVFLEGDGRTDSLHDRR